MVVAGVPSDSIHLGLPVEKNLFDFTNQKTDNPRVKSMTAPAIRLF
jgi:hypothetical protein